MATSNSMTGEPRQPDIFDRAAQRIAEEARAASDVHSGRLDEETLTWLNQMRIRLLGWDGDNVFSRSQETADIADFQALEFEETNWLRQLRAGSSRRGRKQNNGLTVKQNGALKAFHETGGHASQLSQDKIRLIQREGAILLLQLPIREGVYATVASIAALRSAPFTRGNEGVALHETLPNFDLRDVAMPDPTREKHYELAHKRLVIWRTTVRNKLSNKFGKNQTLKIDTAHRGQSLRRLGLGATLKDVLFRVAQQNEKHRLTFNIGTIYHSEDPADAALASNAPSNAHNSWMHAWAWRGRYHDVLLKNRNNPVYMLWKAHTGKLQEGLEAFEGEGGILQRKGITELPDIDFEAMADRVNHQLSTEVLMDRRSPFTDPITPYSPPAEA